MNVASTANPSFTPFVEPGRLTISVLPRVPARPRDSHARGNAGPDAARSASAIPSASSSRIAAVASGVTSRTVRPVPPVVSTTSTSPESAQRASLPEMRSVSSATTLRTTTSYPRSAAQSTTASPDVSARWPTAPRSEIVRMPIRIIPSLTVPYRLLPSSFRPMRHEREIHDFGRHSLTADVDLDLRPRLGAVARQIGRSDTGVHGWGHSPAAHDVDLRAIHKHRVSMPRNRLRL